MSRKYRRICMGMKYLRKFNESFKEDDIHEICKKYRITNYTINNGLVDVDGEVYLHINNLSELPLKFGVVTGNFNCSRNLLTSLEGCPKYVGLSFRCFNNEIKSLEGCPTHVGGDFDCSSNKLTSLLGCPDHVGGRFECSNNYLSSLIYSTKEVDFFYCSDNLLTSLEGCPDIKNTFIFSNNKISSLKGCPSTLSGSFNCSMNSLTTLDYCPIQVGGDVIYANNPVEVIYKLFPNHQSVIDSLDYNYFRGGNVINKIRLTQALEEIGLDCPENIKGYEWELFL